MNRLIVCLGIILIHINILLSQETISVKVDAAQEVGTILPLWQDHWEYHMLHGYGGHPEWLVGPHVQYITEPGFVPMMEQLKPRYIRQSVGAFTNPPTAEYYSNDTVVLKSLWTEFYVGPNTMAGADDPSNYRFQYLDSLIGVYDLIGAKPFLVLDYMPFTLSSDKSPTYNALGPLLSWDNTIRNAPPADNEVFGRVIYQVIKHAHYNLGVEYFEVWNEPDQFLNTNFFFEGDAEDLYDMYAAIIDEVEADQDLAESITIGCCSFAFQSILQVFPTTFLALVQQNNKRMDFLSFHPYSDVDAGYDSTKVDFAISLRDQYVPQAQLINGEWGRLGFDFGADRWKSLEYGLNKITAINHMNSTDIIMAHAATMFSLERTNQQTCCIGIFEVNPIEPKGSAVAYMYMNRLVDHEIQLESISTMDRRVIAGINEDRNSIIVVLAAPNPTTSTNSVDISVSNLPWSGETKVDRYELTEAEVTNQDLNHLVGSYIVDEATISDQLDYASVDNSGRLIIWELSQFDPSSVDDFSISKQCTVHPNPSAGLVEVTSSEVIEGMHLYSMNGRLIQDIAPTNGNNHLQVHLPNEQGIYLLKVFTNSGVFVEKVVRE